MILSGFGQGFWGKKLQKSASECGLVCLVDMGCSVGGKTPSMFAAGEFSLMLLLACLLGAIF